LGLSSELVWELVHSLSGNWSRTGLGVHSKLFWEWVQNWFGSWFRAGVGAGSHLVWEVLQFLFLELARSSFQKCHSWDLGSISRRKFMDNENAER
jgi:hypothetical protein